MSVAVYLHMAASVVVLLRITFFLAESTHEQRGLHMIPLAVMGLSAFAVGVEPLFDSAHITDPQAVFMAAVAVVAWMKRI